MFQSDNSSDRASAYMMAAFALVLANGYIRKTFFYVQCTVCSYTYLLSPRTPLFLIKGRSLYSRTWP